MAIRPLDLAVILLYLLAVTAFGLRFRGGDRSLKSYFLGEERVPWWAISLSIVAAETSTLTLISVPGLAYQGDFSFLQLALGYILGRIIISFTLLPQYFRREIFTAYEWIADRFGSRLRRVTATVFLFTRAAAEGVRVFAVAIVIGMALSLPGSAGGDAAAIGVVILLTLAYTYHGGLTAVIWTDVLQTGIYTIASAIGLWTLVHGLPGGLHGFLRAAGQAGKFHMLSFSLDLTHPYTLLAGIVGGTFFTTASHGTDQLLVQRLLAAQSERKARRALIASGFFVFLQFAFYLTIGTALYVANRGLSTRALNLQPDRIFPQFIVHGLPPGLSGLLIAAILAAAMSNLSAALNSLSSTSVLDFRPARGQERSGEKADLRLAHLWTFAWAFVLFALAMISRHGGRVVETGLSIASVAYGALLGVFLAGLLSRKIGEIPAIIGMIAGLGTNLWLWKATPIAYPWYVPIGCAVTCCVAAAASLLYASDPAALTGAEGPEAGSS